MAILQEYSEQFLGGSCCHQLMFPEHFRSRVFLLSKIHAQTGAKNSGTPMIYHYQNILDLVKW
jgi:hypothetical protein